MGSRATHTPYRPRRRLGLGLALLALVIACQPPGTVGNAAAAAPILPDVALADAAPDAPLPLRGDPDFDPDELSDEARRWFDALWDAIEDPENRSWIEDRAAESDLYHYSRPVNTHVLALLTAFRVTGDLRLLDEIDVVMEAMRDELDDRWQRPAPPDEGSDGFLNWVWTGPDDDQQEGRDVHEKDEMGTHGFVATVTWAYALNRHEESPGGVDYQERASFWLDYLREHFEAKWRERHEVPWPEFPFMGTDHVHETVTFVRYHHYMARLTRERAYAEEARRLTSVMFEELREEPTDDGAALVWRRSLVAEGGSEDYLMPTTYVGLVVGDAIDLHLDGAWGWSDPAVPTGIATSLQAFVMDDGAESFARDVGGGRARAGYDASPQDEWSRQGPYQYAIRGFPLAAAFDASGEIAAVNETVYETLAEERPRVPIPAGLLLHAAWRGTARDDAAASRGRPAGEDLQVGRDAALDGVRGAPF